MAELVIHWTDYMKYRVQLRGFDLEVIERIVRYSTERYSDASTGRLVVVGRHNRMLVIIPCERDAGTLTPITVHVATRQQVKFRLKTGRYLNE